MHEHTGKIFVPVPNKDLLKTEAEEWYERVYVSVYARCYNHGPVARLNFIIVVTVMEPTQVHAEELPVEPSTEYAFHLYGFRSS